MPTKVHSTTGPALLKVLFSSHKASSAAHAPAHIRLFVFGNAFSSSNRGWTLRPDAAAAQTQFVVRSSAPTCVYLKPERGLIRCVSLFIVRALYQTRLTSLKSAYRRCQISKTSSSSISVAPQQRINNGCLILQATRKFGLKPKSGH
jgi:hypothetical protein